MSDYVYVPIRKDLYHKIVVRSGGTIDPGDWAIWLLENWVDGTKYDPDVGWTDEGMAEFYEEEKKRDEVEVGNPDRGYQWQQLFLPNGTELRMGYKGTNYYAQVRHEKINYEGAVYSPSQWAGKIAGNTARNAWRDIWIKFPGKMDWLFADDLRGKDPRGA